MAPRVGSSPEQSARIPQWHDLGPYVAIGGSSYPRKNLQIKSNQPLPKGNDFIAYIDAMGQLDGTRCLLEWTASGRSIADVGPTTGLSWVTGIADVARVVFVRKGLVEIQYLRTTISTAQRQEFGRNRS